jgi:hypothetical protein
MNGISNAVCGCYVTAAERGRRVAEISSEWREDMSYSQGTGVSPHLSAVLGLGQCSRRRLKALRTDPANQRWMEVQREREKWPWRRADRRTGRGLAFPDSHLSRIRMAAWMLRAGQQATKIRLGKLSGALPVAQLA